MIPFVRLCTSTSEAAFRSVDDNSSRLGPDDDLAFDLLPSTINTSRLSLALSDNGVGFGRLGYRVKAAHRGLLVMIKLVGGANGTSTICPMTHREKSPH